MKRTVLIGAAGVLVVIMGAGDALYLINLVEGRAMAAVTQGSDKASHAAQNKPARPVKFVSLPKFVVTLPGVTDADGGNSLLQIGISFGSHHERSIKDFKAVEPMIRSALITTIMSEANNLGPNADASAKNRLAQQLLATVNKIIHREDGRMGEQSFFGAYITSFIMQ
ncbi:flagellar basal body-associated FliL family protein [Acidiphilium acidophilum]|jgi:flagellar basal body-associated protein FliL|uniref:flagellar basal body-associated FliL family protein n=1 Tax=Acidiphilium acidophilum TaxID=76588 RepID=UPI002E8E6DAF|nr:flagellar basal body-associated FliL family protein [Acidiphilium acidophilum]